MPVRHVGSRETCPRAARRPQIALTATAERRRQLLAPPLANQTHPISPFARRYRFFWTWRWKSTRTIAVDSR